eukprot:4975553-Prorocentrum_lima.AAC.1
MAQREVVRPKHFHSKDAPSFEPPLQPSSSAAAASSSSGPSTRMTPMIQPRVPKPKGSEAEKEAVRAQSLK